ncbi:hypothetical protein [Marinovum sp.]|uniref:hypothetical protein n=1 Tax=Marinovum sp. TaxID=2024839 RepID=UPI002B278420|nr:hypothetical protein [Marinovum sp.]
MSLARGLTKLATDFLALKSRRIARLAAMGLAAALLVLVFLSLTLMFGSLALFLALEPALGGPGAAFAVAGLCLLMALVIMLAGALMMRRRRRPPRRAVAVPVAPQTRAGPVPPDPPADKRSRPSGPMAAASGFLAGFVTGKAADKLPPRR